MKPIIFIKFGGSAITNKAKEKEINQENINSLVKQLKKFIDINNQFSFLIGTGAGSFGHLQVNKYQLKNKIILPNQKLGFAIVTNLVQTLNQKVIETFLKENLPAISIKPNSIFFSSNKNSIFSKTIIKALEENYIPVVYGDMVFDKNLGGRVLSTDEIFYHLIKIFNQQKLSINKVIFTGDTNGVLNEKGETIKVVNKIIFPKIQSIFTHNPLIDVTGGMKKKVYWALKITQYKLPCYILKFDNLFNFLTNKLVNSTKII